MLGCENHRQGHHHKLHVGNWHACTFCFFLCVLHHDDELGDAIYRHLILGHISVEDNHIESMRTPTDGVEEGEDVKRCDLCTEGIGIFEIIAPHLVDDVMEELGNATLSRLVTDVVIEAGFMGSLNTNADDCCGIVGERKLGWAHELGIAVLGLVLGNLGEDGHEGVYPIELIVGDYHEEKDDGFPDCKKVIIGQLPFKEGEEVLGLFKEASDCIGHHSGLVDCQSTPSQGDSFTWNSEPVGGCRGL
jgi:hypothetical protein